MLIDYMMFQKRWARWVQPVLFLIFLAAGGVGALAQSNPSPSSEAASTQAAPPQATTAEAVSLYQLKPGDVIAVRFFYNPELNEEVQIRPDGRISLQLIGEVEVASKTIEEAVGLVKEKYVKEIRTPDLTIQVKTYASQKIYVVGEVYHPGLVNLPGPMTVFDAISEAGGIKATGNKNLAVLLRKGPTGSPEGRRLSLFEHGALTAGASTILGPFDVVMVPESKTSRIDRWVDQTIRQMIPLMMTAGFNYLISRQTGAGTGVPIF
jgi:polysaccharide biosynthesis/export protein